MDMKRFTEIESEEAVKRLLDGLDIFSEAGNKFYMEDKKMWINTKTSRGLVHMTINEILFRKWYIKKPFDVRAEMLVRPNEWVGAFKSDNDKWYKTGFDSSEMSAVAAQVGQKETRPVYSDDHVYLMSQAEIDKCIPIEDVPEEEL